MAQLPSNVASLVLDIETVVDERLIQWVKWPSEPDLSPVAARERLATEMFEGSDFVCSGDRPDLDHWRAVHAPLDPRKGT